jgi:hypothetical protein
MFLLLSAITLSGCASTKDVDVMSDTKITGPKVIAMSGDRGAWIYQIEKRLKADGFTLNRMESQQVTVEKQSETKTGIYNEATARYVLNVQGSAPNGAMTRCYGGGYNFNYIDAELIDLKDNKTIFHYSNSGYSEGCPPLSGHIFGDIAELTKNAWK